MSTRNKKSLFTSLKSPFLNLRAFTLTEILIVLVFASALVAIMLPSTHHTIPDGDKLKFKSANNFLISTIRELISDGKYYDGSFAELPVLSVDQERELSEKFFCQSFADLISAKVVNCRDTLIGGDGKITIEDINKINSDEIRQLFDTACDAAAAEVKGNPEGTEGNPEIMLANGVSFYQTDPRVKFNDEDMLTQVQVGDSDIKLYNRYKVLCLDIDTSNSDKTNTVFGYGIRVDGKVIPGKRATEWIKADIFDD